MTDIIPIGKLGKATKAVGNISPEIRIMDKIRTIRPTKYKNLTDQQIYTKIQNVMEDQKVSVANGKTLYLSPDKKDITIV